MTLTLDYHTPGMSSPFSSSLSLTEQSLKFTATLQSCLKVQDSTFAPFRPAYPLR